MALVKCPDCDREISETAPTCVGCGRPMQPQVTHAPPDPSERFCGKCGARLTYNGQRKKSGLASALFVIGALPIIFFALGFLATPGGAMLFGWPFLLGGLLMCGFAAIVRGASGTAYRHYSCPGCRQGVELPV